MRILLAEDEKEMSSALVAILKHNNYSVDAVYDGADALDYGKSQNYDVIILDIMMPKLTRKATCTRHPYPNLNANREISDRRSD
ncbi:MAG: two component transcriptional regulator, winged helix family [Firmicutes bacterium]|nr:two component transcriptional regulator, winged helix family [Bacillota bacterium]